MHMHTCVKVVYPQEDLDGLGTGSSCGSTWDILSDDSEASVALSSTTEVLSKAKMCNTITGNHCLSYKSYSVYLDSLHICLNSTVISGL